MQVRRPKQYTRESYLPASVLARHGRCETLVVLERREGETVTAGGEEARLAGMAEHDRFHQEVTRSHNRPGRRGKAKGPCFIASAVYGYDDARTDELRGFRDAVLLRTAWTAWTVRVYYAISPPIARWLGGHPAMAGYVGRGLDELRARVVRPLMEK